MASWKLGWKSGNILVGYWNEPADRPGLEAILVFVVDVVGWQPA
jgi:hypothetical protein